MISIQMLKTVLWYTERKVNDITLGGLIILVIIRTIQYNILKMRDKYLHTNCLAALANMSSKFRSLHPYVSQRLISVFETLAKRHIKLIDGLEKHNKETPNREESEETSNMVQDINVLEEVIRMLLEILNSVFTHQLPQNRHLVYTLLYKKDIFDAFREYDATQDLVYNLDIVSTVFYDFLCAYYIIRSNTLLKYTYRSSNILRNELGPKVQNLPCPKSWNGSKPEFDTGLQTSFE